MQIIANFWLFKDKWLVPILLLALILRVYGVNWDQNYHLHPDERMITMVATRIHLPQNTNESELLLTPLSPLNPQFFAYGSLPIYLLTFGGWMMSTFDPSFAVYDKINLVGRVMSALFDLGSLIFLFLIAKKIFNQMVAYVSAFFYAIAVLPIQLSHFYAVDTPLTFFIILGLFLVINFYQTPTFKQALGIGIVYGLAMATKTSALLLAVPIGLSLILPLVPQIKNVPELLKKLTSKTLPLTLLILASAVLTFVIFEPYALIDMPTFLKQTEEQQAMTKDAFTFPYTLQYVNKVPYLHELKNIYYFGLGPGLATLSFFGLMLLIYQLILSKHLPQKKSLLIIIGYLAIYFYIVGGFAIGFVRYMLLLYPLFCLFAGYLIWQMHRVLAPILPRNLLVTVGLLLMTFLLIWPLSFVSIYSNPNPRTTATTWITQNIPPGSTLATEHWDDGLPIAYQSLYVVNELPMYEPDTPLKWQKINQALASTDYIIIASHRLYRPLMDLTNCPELPADRCYTKSAKYYGDLFAGRLGFTKIAEFTNFPTIPFTNTIIDDFDSDETFTVYDQPKIMIFKNNDK